MTPFTRREAIELGALALAGLLTGCRPKKVKTNLPKGKRVGVIVNPDWSFSHSANTFAMYGLMRSIGCSHEDVHVLSYPLEFFNESQQRSLYWDADASQRYVVDEPTQPKILGPASKTNINFCLEAVVDELGENDSLFFYVTGHGGYENGNSNIQALDSDGRLVAYTDEEFKQALEGLKSKPNVFIFDGCHQGNFLNVLESENNSFG